MRKDRIVKVSLNCKWKNFRMTKAERFQWKRKFHRNSESTVHEHSFWAQRNGKESIFRSRDDIPVHGSPHSHTNLLSLGIEMLKNSLLCQHFSHTTEFTFNLHEAFNYYFIERVPVGDLRLVKRIGGVYDRLQYEIFAGVILIEI